MTRSPEKTWTMGTMIRLKGSREERKGAEKYVYINKINKNVIKGLS